MDIDTTGLYIKSKGPCTHICPPFLLIYFLPFILCNLSYLNPSASTEILVEVASTTEQASDHHRVIWCPYIPDEQAGGEEGDEPAHLLVLTHGPCVGSWALLTHLAVPLFLG